MHAQRKPIKRAGRKEVELGDFTEFTEDEIMATFRMLQNRIKEIYVTKVASHGVESLALFYF
ncbi:hypothetical protein [Gracilibacillus sp. YIM 98692]|uniref:hypothetical protein n=1 Tax=Gracilibacillus sp. YIM 98692 TaxID=2663532 RepID=UPI0013D488A1|nr:hypothetical protein [Gracilibacillus sp. YIM 98692]